MFFLTFFGFEWKGHCIKTIGAVIVLKCNFLYFNITRLTRYLKIIVLTLFSPLDLK